MKKVVTAVGVAAVLVVGGVGGVVAATAGDGSHTTTTTTTTQPDNGVGGGRGSGARQGASHNAVKIYRVAATAAAQAIGVSPQELRSDVEGGQTVAQVARAKGVDPATVVNAVQTALKQAADQAVQAGNADSTRVQRLEQRLPEFADRFVNETAQLLQSRKAGAGGGPATTPSSPDGGAGRGAS